MGFGLGFCCHCAGSEISTSNVDSCSFCPVAYRRYSITFSQTCILGNCTCCNSYVNQTYVVDYVSGCTWESAELDQSFKQIAGVVTCQNPIVGDSLGQIPRVQLVRLSSTQWELRLRYRIALGGGSPETVTQLRHGRWTITTDASDCLTYNSTAFVADSYVGGATGSTYNPSYSSNPCRGGSPTDATSSWSYASFTMTSAA